MVQEKTEKKRIGYRSLRRKKDEVEELTGTVKNKTSKIVESEKLSLKYIYLNGLHLSNY